MIKEEFRKYLEEAIGSDNALVAFSAFEDSAQVSVRHNPFKAGPCMQGERIPWNAHGALLSERPVFTLDPYLHGGGYYVQDSSSMFVGFMFRECLKNMELPVTRPVRVLDLCAAPGGKSTDLAASLRECFGDRFILVSNEVMKQRVGVLADNMALWGDPNVVVTSDDPRAFAAMSGYFDIIVTDVPCSGEGMFRKDEQAQEQWSEDNVALCASRQKRIVADMWQSLRKGGMLIYSTCTFNRLENDDNVSWIAEELGAEVVTDRHPEWELNGVIKTAHGYSLVPGHVKGEGQYCAVLRKTSEETIGSYRIPSGKNRMQKQTLPPESLKKLLSVDVKLRMKGDTVTAVPAVCADDVALLESCLHVIAAGCALGIMKGDTLVPDADLALSLILADGSFPYADVDRQTALEFLHKEAIRLEGAPKGYILIRYQGLPLGFVKNLGNRCNNLHPQGRRIRMDIR